MATMTAADVLDAAADLIKRDGWWNGTVRPQPRSGARCAGAAIYYIVGSFDHPAYIALADHVIIRAGDHFLRIVDWNDAQESDDKVIWTMRQVAADLRETAEL